MTLKKLQNIYKLTDITGLSIASFAITYNYLDESLKNSSLTTTPRNPLTSSIIASSPEIRNSLIDIRNTVESKFDIVENIIITPSKKTIITNAANKKEIKFVKHLSDSQSKLFAMFKRYLTTCREILETDLMLAKEVV